MSRFFALPEEKKALIDKAQSRHFRGWERVGSERTNNRVDHREQIDFWSDTCPRPADATPAYYRLLGPNTYLPDSVLPNFKSVSTRWFSSAARVADDLMQVFSVGLGLEPLHLEGVFGPKDERMSLTKFIHYPPSPEGGAGVNAHHDTGFVTVLAPGPTPGLEVQDAQGEWIPVRAAPGAFVINIGEMLQGMTGNYFLATPHRVITSEERLSCAYFHGPALSTPLDPLPIAPRFFEAVAASPRHRGAGWMAAREELLAGGTEDMRAGQVSAVYGEQLWNYFVRSYPENVKAHYPDVVQ
mmetsp:Transcript_44971/g.118803  ORF Transcript_44971/g.118803 Transcript_44971/m.118803 type:complete len:298 (-) Transcript_44971:72-965(-)